jgi:hypothetical protein
MWKWLAWTCVVALLPLVGYFLAPFVNQEGLRDQLLLSAALSAGSILVTLTFRSLNKNPRWSFVVVGCLGIACTGTWLLALKSNIEVTAFPRQVFLAPGETFSLKAEAVGLKDRAVVWSIPEGTEGGLITPDETTTQGPHLYSFATYQAPNAVGTFHVIAASHADSSLLATVSIEVRGQLKISNPSKLRTMLRRNGKPKSISRTANNPGFVQ